MYHKRPSEQDKLSSPKGNPCKGSGIAPSPDSPEGQGAPPEFCKGQGLSLGNEERVESEGRGWGFE